MIRNLLRLAALGTLAGLTVAAVPVAIAWWISDLPIPTEYKLTALWWLVCAEIVAVGTCLAILFARAVRGYVRARRAAREALQDARRQPRVVHGPLMAWGPRDPADRPHDETPTQRIAFVPYLPDPLDATAEIADLEHLLAAPSADVPPIPQQRRPRPRPEGDTK